MTHLSHCPWFLLQVATSAALFDGEVLPRSLRRLDLGGADLDAYLAKYGAARHFRLSLGCWLPTAKLTLRPVLRLCLDCFRNAATTLTSGDCLTRSSSVTSRY